MEKGNEAQPCTRNKNHLYIPMLKWRLDEFGNEIEYYDCANCEEESREIYREKIEKASDVDVPELIEEYGKILESEKKETTINKRTYNMITKYSKRLSEMIGAPLSACRAMIEFDISASLNRLYFADGMGRVLPNLGFMWIAPSGAVKTPLYSWGVMSMYEKIFMKWKYVHYNRTGGKALISSLSKIKNENLDHGRIIALITQDEVSTLAKESNADGLSDVFEVFAQAYDGQLSSSNTVIRGSEQPKPCYSPMWFQGTPSFLKYLNEDFWDIGMGNRLLFVAYEPTFVKEIPKTLHAKEFYGDFIIDLEKLRTIEKAEFTDEAWKTYNEYQMSVMSDIQNAQLDIESSFDNSNFDVISKVKFPVLILKMSFIMASARFNFDSTGILQVEKEDVISAIKEIERYHKNMVMIHTIWETRSSQKLRHESIETIARKIINHIEKLQRIGKCYRIETRKDTGLSLAFLDKDGKWVRHSDLLRQSHMKAIGPKSFGEIIITLLEREEIIKRECTISSKDQNSTTVFYRLK